MQNLLQILLLSSLIAAAIAQSCATAQDPSLLLQTGSIQVVNPYQSGPPSAIRKHTFAVPITYTVPATGFQVAASIGNLLLSSQFANLWDFTVRGGPGSNPSEAQIVLFITDDGTWSLLQVNYLVSSRSDLFLGSFIADAYIFESTTTNQLTLNYYVPNWQPTDGEVIAVTEFAGLRTYLNQPLILSFATTTFAKDTGLLKVVINTNSPLEEIYLTYYWWIIGATDLTFSSFNVGEAALAYSFVGLEGINAAQTNYAGTGFNTAGLLTCNQTVCPKACVNSQTCASIGGAVQANVCFICGVNSQWDGNACVCNPGYFLMGGVCGLCQANSVWNGNACECVGGYNLVNGKCLACPPLSVWIPSQQICACLSGYYMINGACTACSANSGWNGSACVCLSGFYLINNACSQCPSNTIWNGTACTCQTNTYLVGGTCQQLPPNSTYNGTAFVCLTNYYLINGVCSQCPAKSTWNGTSCVCNPKFYLINGVCVQCGQHSTYNGVSCACDAGYYLINNACGQCSKNQTWNGTNCVCQNGYYLSGKNCVPCGANSQWNGSACVCVTGYYLINNVCTPCAANQVWNGSSCVCASNYYLIGGVCQTCPTNTTWNGLACVPNCPTKSTWNGSACVCNSGFYQIQGSCLPCDPNSLYNGVTCVCNPGFFGNYQLCTACDKSCATCLQAGPNACSSCPNGLFLINGACGCGAGKVAQGLTCVSCPADCIACSDPNSCSQCAQGYSLIQQIVGGNSVLGCAVPGPASPSSTLSLTGIVVGNNVIYQGITLSTLPAYFLTNNCANCSDLFTVLPIPNNLGITYTVQYVPYSQYWFILTFRFSSVTPSFQFKVQINFKYASYFSMADMAQGKLGSVSPLQYPTNTPSSPLTTSDSVAIQSRSVTPSGQASIIPAASVSTPAAVPSPAPAASSVESSKVNLAKLFG